MPKRYSQQCPIAHALDAVGERWSLLIVRELMLGPLRFTDLLVALPGMGTRMLTERLKHLTDEAVVTVRELPPPASTTAYALTDRGFALAPVLTSLAVWGTPLLAEGKKADRRSPDSAVLMLWNRAVKAKHRAHADYQFRVGDAPFGFQVRPTGVKAHRGELTSPDGSAALSTNDAFALLTGELDVKKAIGDDRLVLGGSLDRTGFAELFAFAA